LRGAPPSFSLYPARVAFIIAFGPFYRVVSLLDYFMGFIMSFVVFSHGFYWANGFELAHCIVLYVRRLLTYKRRSPPSFQIIGD
jgi:hypothetical protein